MTDEDRAKYDEIASDWWDRGYESGRKDVFKAAVGVFALVVVIVLFVLILAGA